MSFSRDNQKILRGTFNLGHPILVNPNKETVDFKATKHLYRTFSIAKIVIRI